MRVVVIGAGYAGVGLAQSLGRRANQGKPQLEITLINSSPHHVIKTELHTLAAGTVDDPGDVTVPLESLFDRLPVRTICAEVVGIDPERQSISLNNGESVEYDQLATALGASPEYFGIPGLGEFSTSIGDINPALYTRRLVDETLRNVASGREERAEIVVGGGGLTGIELAGELAHVLKHRYATSGVNNRVGLTVVEAAPTLMPGLEPKLGQWSHERLEALGVRVLTGHMIAEVTEDAIQLKHGDDGKVTLQYNLIVWSGGVRGNQLLGSTFEADRRGKVLVDERLRVNAFPNVRVLGDSACIMGPEGRPLPPTAQGAIQQGAWVAEDMWAEISGQKSGSSTYVEKNKGVLASVGPDYGVGLIGKRAVKGRWVKWVKDVNTQRYLSSIGAKEARRRVAAAQSTKPSQIGMQG